ncbi:MAG: hypothetical protein QXF15_02005 [Candidatus Aenigmatarchaeota archaeon]
MAINFEEMLNEAIDEIRKKEEINEYASAYINTAFSNDPYKKFIQTRIQNSWTNIEPYCEIFGNHIDSRNKIIEFSLKELNDPNNKTVIIKGGDFDIFSGHFQKEYENFSKAYKECAKNTENMVLIFDSRVKKGGDQLEKNYKNAKEILKDTNAKILCEGTYFHAMLFEKKDGKYNAIVWESKVRNKEDGTPGRTDGFPHPAELSVYRGCIINPDHKFYNMCKINIEILFEKIGRDALNKFLKRVKGRNDILIDPKTNTYLILGLPQYIEHIAEIAEKIET